MTYKQDVSASAQLMVDQMKKFPSMYKEFTTGEERSGGLPPEIEKLYGERVNADNPAYGQSSKQLKVTFDFSNSTAEERLIKNGADAGKNLHVVFFTCRIIPSEGKPFDTQLISGDFKKVAAVGGEWYTRINYSDRSNDNGTRTFKSIAPTTQADNATADVKETELADVAAE